MSEDSKPIIKVKGSRQNPKVKEKKEKVNRTAFLFTVSTNQRYPESDPNIDNDMEFFEDVIADICNNLSKYIIMKEEDKPWNTQNIKDADVTYNVELGPKTRQLHAHILIKMKHNTKLHLNYTAIREKLCEELGLNNVFASNKLLKGNGVWEQDFLESYLSKPIFT